MFYKTERMGVFIDGSNLYAASKALGFDIDYNLLGKWLRERGIVTRISYYTAIVENEEFSPVRPLIDWLGYNGYTIVTKPAREYTDSLGRRKIKGNMDIELAIDALELAPHVSHIVLMTGDGDFIPLVDALHRKGVRVTAISTIRSQPSMVADGLRRAVDSFIDLSDLQPAIARAARVDE